DVDEDLALYVLVRVRGTAHMGHLLATDIDVIDEIEFFGFINTLDLEMGKLVVDGRPILVNADTDIDGTLEEGAFVTGKAVVDMGKVTATEIRVFELPEEL
ncbi:MAG: hypothetical protein HY667_00410, partial [Chloroflexi bacterium]|nr:hypothetical protein [Chloroflexota bacterium]